MEGKTPFTLMVHGHSGHGKSRLGASAPAPVLVIDLEGRGHYLPYAKTFWDPAQGPPPEYDETWSHCVTVVRRYSELERIKQWLESGQHQFRSVVLDSLMEAQKRFIDDLAGVQQMKDYDWGTVLRNLESLVRDLRDCTLMPANPVEVVVVVVGTKETESRRLVPLLQGQLRDTLPYYFDACGYIYLATDNDGNTVRRLRLEPTDLIVAKDGTDLLVTGFGPVIENADLTTLWNHIRERKAAA